MFPVILKIVAATVLFELESSQVLNPLDANCDRKRRDALCITHLTNAAKIDKDILNEKADVKIFLPFKFHIHTISELFQPNQYMKYLGKEKHFH